MFNHKNLLFGGLNLVQGALIGSIPLLVASREPAVNWVLAGVAILMLVSGPALVFAGRIGRIVAAIACLVHGLTGTIIAALVAFAASYLYGIYGRHGVAVGSVASVGAVFILVVFWLVPAHELRYLKISAGEK